MFSFLLISVDESWRCLSLPILRVKKVMKAEEFALKELRRLEREQRGALIDHPTVKASNNIYMLSSEAVLLQTKACEFFIREITLRAWRHTNLHRRKTIQRSDIWSSVGDTEMYDFLIDIVPRAKDAAANNAATGKPETTDTTSAVDAFPSATNPFMYNTQTALANTTNLMNAALPTASNLENMGPLPTAADPAVMEVAQPAFNLDNVSFVPMPQTPTASDEIVPPSMQYPTTPSQPWNLEGNSDL